ncbi:MAG TPA: hypothetical protein VIT68_00780 [Candidatus Gracilibacteria bacterium]
MTNPQTSAPSTKDTKPSYSPRVNAEVLDERREVLYAQYLEWSGKTPPMAKFEDPQSIKKLAHWELDLLEKGMAHVERLEKSGIPQRSTVFGMAMVRPVLQVRDIIYLYVIIESLDPKPAAAKTVVKGGKTVVTEGEAHFVIVDPEDSNIKHVIEWAQLKDQKGNLDLFLRRQFSQFPRMKDLEPTEEPKNQSTEEPTEEPKNPRTEEPKVEIRPGEIEDPFAMPLPTQNPLEATVIAAGTNQALAERAAEIARQNPEMTKEEAAAAAIATQAYDEDPNLLPEIIEEEERQEPRHRDRLQSIFEAYHRNLSKCTHEDGTLDSEKVTTFLKSEYEAIKKEEDYAQQAAWGLTKATKKVGSDFKAVFTEFDFGQFWSEGEERYRSRAEIFRVTMGFNGSELANQVEVEKQISRWARELEGLDAEIYENWIPRKRKGVQIEDDEGITALDLEASDVEEGTKGFLKARLKSIPEAYLGTNLANTYVRLLGEGRTAKNFTQWRKENSDETYIQKGVYAIYGLYLKLHKVIQNFGWFKDWFGEYEAKENKHLGIGFEDDEDDEGDHASSAGIEGEKSSKEVAAEKEASIKAYERYIEQHKYAISERKMHVSDPEQIKLLKGEDLELWLETETRKELGNRKTVWGALMVVPGLNPRQIVGIARDAKRKQFTFVDKAEKGQKVMGLDGKEVVVDTDDAPLLIQHQGKVVYIPWEGLKEALVHKGKERQLIDLLDASALKRDLQSAGEKDPAWKALESANRTALASPGNVLGAAISGKVRSIEHVKVLETLIKDKILLARQAVDPSEMAHLEVDIGGMYWHRVSWDEVRHLSPRDLDKHIRTVYKEEKAKREAKEKVYTAIAQKLATAGLSSNVSAYSYINHQEAHYSVGGFGNFFEGRDGWIIGNLWSKGIITGKDIGLSKSFTVEQAIALLMITNLAQNRIVDYHKFEHTKLDEKIPQYEFYEDDDGIYYNDGTFNDTDLVTPAEFKILTKDTGLTAYQATKFLKEFYGGKVIRTTNHNNGAGNMDIFDPHGA